LGVRPLIYLSPAFAIEILKNAPALGQYRLWIAHATTASAPLVPKPWTTWAFWQYSDIGKVPGISEPVDADRFNGSLDDLKSLAVPAPPSSGGNE